MGFETQDVERKVLSILKVLSNSHEVVGSRTIANRLKDLGIELSPEDTKDRIMLVCFWDMQQRPSRHCMRKLAECAEELKNKGVAVVAIQASKVNKGMLKEWMNNNNVSFQVGVIHGDADVFIPVEGGKATAEALPNSNLLIVEGMGHTIPEAEGPRVFGVILEHAK